MRRLLAILTLISATALGQTAPSASRQPLTRERGDAILNELRLIRQAPENYPKKGDAPSPKAAQKVSMSVSPGWHALGREDAPVTIIEFSDYQCAYCRLFQRTTFLELKQKYIDTGKVRFVSRDYPLSFHSDALPAAIAAECAGQQGKFWELRDRMDRDGADLGLADLEQQAQAVGLNHGLSELRARPETRNPGSKGNRGGSRAGSSRKACFSDRAYRS